MLQPSASAIYPRGLRRRPGRQRGRRFLPEFFEPTKIHGRRAIRFRPRAHACLGIGNGPARGRKLALAFGRARPRRVRTHSLGLDAHAQSRRLRRPRNRTRNLGRGRAGDHGRESRPAIGVARLPLLALLVQHAEFDVERVLPLPRARRALVIVPGLRSRREAISPRGAARAQRRALTHGCPSESSARWFTQPCGSGATSDWCAIHMCSGSFCAASPRTERERWKRAGRNELCRALAGAECARDAHVRIDAERARVLSHALVVQLGTELECRVADRREVRVRHRLLGGQHLESC